jgi:hypothetical protein
MGSYNHQVKHSKMFCLLHKTDNQHMYNWESTVHSVTIKFPNWRYCSNTTNAIYQDEWD